jgi:hypothetical protein
MCFFSFNSSICHALLLNYSVWIQIRIRIRIFFRIRIRKKVRILSDSASDPQHWHRYRNVGTGIISTYFFDTGLPVLFLVYLLKKALRIA